jgi:hypothetical protein
MLTQTQTSCCPQAGFNTFSSWSAWTGTCGTVVRSRVVTGCTATCGASCYPPALIDLMQSRSLSPCCLPVSGNWTYSEWSAWSAACGTVTRTRTTLTCLGASCGGSCGCPTASELQQSQILAPCCTSSAYGIVPVSNWIVSDWSSWSGTCGNVTRTRSTILCNQPPCSSPCTPLPASSLTQTKVLTPCCPNIIHWSVVLSFERVYFKLVIFFSGFIRAGHLGRPHAEMQYVHVSLLIALEVFVVSSVQMLLY